MSDTIHGAPGEKLCLYVLKKLHEWPQELIIKLKYPDAFIHSIVSREGLKKCKNVLWQQCLRGFAGEFCITALIDLEMKLNSASQHTEKAKEQKEMKHSPYKQEIITQHQEKLWYILRRHTYQVEGETG